VDQNRDIERFLDFSISARVVWVAMSVDDEFWFQCVFIHVCEDFFCFMLLGKPGVNDDGFLRYFAVDNVAVGEKHSDSEDFHVHLQFQ